MVSRFLITTADETTWQTDVPVLFLGEWCKLYARRDTWAAMDAEVVPYHWDDREKFSQDYQYLHCLYEKLLSELAAKLNEIHGAGHSVRYWRILIGPWLQYFAQMVFDRWEMIQSASKRYEISGTRVLERSLTQLVPNDMADFVRLFVGDQWNQAIYGYLLEHWTGVKCERLATKPHTVGISTVPRSKVSDAPQFRSYISTIAGKMSGMFVRPNEAFFISTYFPARKSFALQWQLGQIPRSWHFIDSPVSAVNLNRRKWRLSDNCDTDFERMLRALISLQIPTAYLEGYGDLVAKVFGLRWPQRPKFIFTSNAQNSNDVFKAWAAQKVDAGTPLVIGQHGGGYGVAKLFSNERHEIAVSDRYLTWGWSADSCLKLVKTFCLMIGSNKRTAWDPKGIALLVGAIYPRYSYKLTSEPLSSQWLDYFEGQCRFVEALPDNRRGQLLVRLNSVDFDWCQKQRWQDRFPQIRVDDGIVPIASLVKKSRLYISTYNATTFLESLALNIPTIMFWNPQHWELRSSAQPYFDRLKEIGIFHEMPESAAAKVAEVWDDVPGWWQQPEIQKARRVFCDRFARTVDNPIRVMKEALTFGDRKL